MAVAVKQGMFHESWSLEIFSITFIGHLVHYLTTAHNFSGQRSPGSEAHREHGLVVALPRNLPEFGFLPWNLPKLSDLVYRERKSAWQYCFVYVLVFLQARLVF